MSQCLIDKPRPLPATQWKGAPQDQPRSPASAAWGNKPAGQRAPCWRLQTPGREMTQQGTGGGVLRMAARASPAYTQGRGLPALVQPVRHTHPQLSSALTGDSSGRPAPKQQPGGGQWACGGVGEGLSRASGRGMLGYRAVRRVETNSLLPRVLLLAGPGEGLPRRPGFLIYEFWALGTIC